MQYLLLIYQAETVMHAQSQAETEAVMAGYKTFTADIVKNGQFKSGDALQPVATARSVQVRDGKTIATDGPFAETREQLGGYYLVEAEDMAAAEAIAARIPSAGFGTIEVRPVMVWDEPGS